jgi:heterodisulfide reductase subunit C
MDGWDGRPKIKYQTEVDPNFAQEIMAMPGGEALLECIQCGTCSGTCPLSIYMDYTPRRIVAMVRAGFKDEVLKSATIWLCASCYACTVECPKNIKITDIMYALKRKAIQERVYPRRFPIPVLAREFFTVVERQGRNSEGEVLVRLYLKTNPLRSLHRIGVGLKLWLRGRFAFGRHRIRRRDELQALLRAVEPVATKGAWHEISVLSRLLLCP